MGIEVLVPPTMSLNRSRYLPFRLSMQRRHPQVNIPGSSNVVALWIDVLEQFDIHIPILFRFPSHYVLIVAPSHWIVFTILLHVAP
jgi:hypothetical protein